MQMPVRVMGLRPTQWNQNDICRHLRESGRPSLLRKRMDSRFRGNGGFSGERGISARGLCSKGGNDEEHHER